MENLNEMKLKLESILKENDEKEKLVSQLKCEKIVESYLNESTKLGQLRSCERNLKEQIKRKEMMECNHYFVTIKKDSYFDGHRTQTDYIYKCIHCGLTNKYLDDVFLNDCLMNEVIKEVGMHNFKSHGYCDEDKIKELKNIYDKFKSEYPTATDNDIETHISLVKKMRGGKLC